MTIHSTHPFATPEGSRSPVRRLRGRLPAAVTLWTAAGPGGRAGLTVSSTLVVDGAPGSVLGILDPESELWEMVERTGRFAVAPLRATDAQLADKFAGQMPAPGGPFSGYQWQDTPFGPVLAGVSGWAGCHLGTGQEVGWGLLVTGTIAHVDIGAEESEPLIHHRGRYTSAR